VTYGLGELPQAFARLSAVYGGTYMLGLPFEEVVYNESGVAVGVKAGGETAKCKMVVGDPSYFPGKTRKTGQVIRTICILDHPVKDTNNNKACQIIIPQKQVDRQNDIYISVISSAFQVAPEGKFIAIVSTKVETANPEQEIKAGLDLLEPILDKFTFVSDTFEPVDDGSASKTFISTSYDATSHLETTADDILALFARITGKELEWDKLPIAAEEGSS
jgi:Rab GDP dissociation inhibitor